MEETINRLITILNKYPVKELNKIYRDKEVELEIASFTKYPDVRWSENLKKRMIQAAKRKRISKGRIKYIEEQIDELNSYNIGGHINTAISDVKQMFEILDKTNIEKSEINLLHIEFSDAQHVAHIQAYGKYKVKWYEQELGAFESNFNSAKYWEELESRKFSSMSELLEIIDVDDEEYPQIYCQVRELRVFNVIKKAIEQPELKEKIKSKYPQLNIEIGMHDDEFFIIYENK